MRNTCNKCGKKFKGRSRYQEYCNDCYRDKREVKKMVTDEQKEDDNTENKIEEVSGEKKVKKKSITETRVELATACIDLLKEKEVPKEEWTKIFSRAYSIAKK